LTATLLHYLKDEAEREIPIWRMVSLPLDEVKGRAEHWKRELGCGRWFRVNPPLAAGRFPGKVSPPGCCCSPSNPLTNSYPGCGKATARDRSHRER